MGQFLKWKRDHLGEAVDKKDTVTFDIPLLIRVLEFAREDLKSDILLHKMVLIDAKLVKKSNSLT